MENQNPGEVQTLMVQETNVSLNPFASAEAFMAVQQMAEGLSKSSLVPDVYKGKPENVLVAMEMASRMTLSPFVIMQNLDIIHGKPSFNSKFVIAQLNQASGYDGPLMFEYGQDAQAKTVEFWHGKGQQRQKRTTTIKDTWCQAWRRTSSGDVVKGPKVSLEMAIKEGWYFKSGSKWQTMPQVMLSYRAAKFWGNLYAPDRVLGLPAQDEAVDMTSENVAGAGVIDIPHVEIPVAEIGTPAPEPKPAPARTRAPKATAKKKTAAAAPAPAPAPAPTPAAAAPQPAPAAPQTAAPAQNTAAPATVPAEPGGDMPSTDFGFDPDGDPGEDDDLI